MKKIRTMTICVFLILALGLPTIVSCQKSPAPTQETAWTGRSGNLAAWGYGADYIYGWLFVPKEKKDLLLLWKWQKDGTIKETAVRELPSSGNIMPLSNDMCGLSLDPGDKYSPWPYALLKMGNEKKIIKKWLAPKYWWFSKVGRSLNGKYIALVASENADSPHSSEYELGVERKKIALIDVAKKELKWVTGNLYQREGAIRRVVVTEDGRYVAITGWDNGTAMIDTKDSKLLWVKKPKDEIAAGYAAFTPDGKIIYVVGSEGCVYEMDVKTGKILRKFWATTTGKLIYAHRASAIALSKDGKWLAAGTGPEGQVYIWNLQEKDSKPRMLNHGHGTILIVAFSPDSEHFVSVGGGVLKVWPINTNKSAPDKKKKEKAKASRGKTLQKGIGAEK